MLRRIKERAFRWLLYDLAGDSNYLSHARLEMSNWGQEGEEPSKWLREGTLDLLCVLAMQGHSGGSIGIAVAIFKKLALFEPLGPLTGEDWEWSDELTLDGTLQNRRCSHVFKNPDGDAYDIQGRIFRDPEGCTYTGSGSAVAVTFPYTPSSVYVDVDEDGNENEEPREPSPVQIKEEG